MSIDDIRKRDAEDIDLRAAIPWATALRVDVRALLDEVDQLRAALFVSEERVALIREAVVELEFGACAVIDSISRDKVLDIIEGTKS